MEFSTFHQLVGSINLSEPCRYVLYAHLKRELIPLGCSQDEESFIRNAYTLSFEGHRTTRPVMSDEAYFFHPFRTTVRSIRRQMSLGMRDAHLVATILINQCFEDVGTHSPLLTRTNIAQCLGSGVALDVHHITHHSEIGEKRREYLERLLQSSTWRSLTASFECRLDEVENSFWLPEEKRIAFLHETEHLFLGPLLDRLFALLAQEFIQYRIGTNVLHLHESLREELRSAVLREQALLTQKVA